MLFLLTLISFDLVMARTLGTGATLPIGINVLVGIMAPMLSCLLRWTRPPLDGWSWVWFGSAGVMFLLAYWIHEAAETGHSFCAVSNAVFTPSSVIQGHAFWHLGTATMAYCLYLYYRREKIWD